MRWEWGIATVVEKSVQVVCTLFCFYRWGNARASWLSSFCKYNSDEKR